MSFFSTHQFNFLWSVFDVTVLQKNIPNQPVVNMRTVLKTVWFAAVFLCSSLLLLCSGKSAVNLPLCRPSDFIPTKALYPQTKYTNANTIYTNCSYRTLIYSIYADTECPLSPLLPYIPPLITGLNSEHSLFFLTSPFLSLFPSVLSCPVLSIWVYHSLCLLCPLKDTLYIHQRKARVPHDICGCECVCVSLCSFELVWARRTLLQVFGEGVVLVGVRVQTYFMHIS